MVGLELLRFAAPRGLDERIGVAAGLLPRVGDGDDLKVGRGEVRNDALFEVGTFAAGADADLGDADAVVDTDGAGAFGGGEEARVSAAPAARAAEFFKKSRRGRAGVVIKRGRGRDGERGENCRVCGASDGEDGVEFCGEFFEIGLVGEAVGAPLLGDQPTVVAD